MHDTGSTGRGPALRAQGAFSASRRGGWRLGWLSLRDSRFAFHVAGSRAAAEIDVAAITGLDRERRTFILVNKHVLRLTYRSVAAARHRSCWLITARLDDWEAALGGRPAGPAAAVPPGQVPGSLAARLAALPAASALILDFLACRGHATTAELMTLIGTEAEESLLAEMQAGLGQLEPELGSPAVRYADRYFDAAAGQVRRHTWRIGERAAAGWLASRVPAEVFAEGGELLVVTSVPTQARGVPPVARAAADGRGLVLRHGPGQDQWIELGCQVTGEPRCAVSQAGTLVIRGLRRAGREDRT
jgi:hypothetical protein